MSDTKPRKLERPKAFSTKMAPNAIHVLIGMLANARKSLAALQRELTETWDDINYLQAKITHSEQDLKALRKLYEARLSVNTNKGDPNGSCP